MEEINRQVNKELVKSNVSSLAEQNQEYINRKVAAVSDKTVFTQMETDTINSYMKKTLTDDGNEEKLVTTSQEIRGEITKKLVEKANTRHAKQLENKNVVLQNNNSELQEFLQEIRSVDSNGNFEIVKQHCLELVELLMNGTMYEFESNKSVENKSVENKSVENKQDINELNKVQIISQGQPISLEVAERIRELYNETLSCADMYVKKHSIWRGKALIPWGKGQKRKEAAIKIGNLLRQGFIGSIVKEFVPWVDEQQVTNDIDFQEQLDMDIESQKVASQVYSKKIDQLANNDNFTDKIEFRDDFYIRKAEEARWDAKRKKKCNEIYDDLYQRTINNFQEAMDEYNKFLDDEKKTIQSEITGNDAKKIQAKTAQLKYIEDSYGETDIGKFIVYINKRSEIETDTENNSKKISELISKKKAFLNSRKNKDEEEKTKAALEDKRQKLDDFFYSVKDSYLIKGVHETDGYALHEKFRAKNFDDLTKSKDWFIWSEKILAVDWILKYQTNEFETDFETYDEIMKNGNSNLLEAEGTFRNRDWLNTSGLSWKELVEKTYQLRNINKDNYWEVDNRFDRHFLENKGINNDEKILRPHYDPRQKTKKFYSFGELKDQEITEKVKAFQQKFGVKVISEKKDQDAADEKSSEILGKVMEDEELRKKIIRVIWADKMLTSEKLDKIIREKTKDNPEIGPKDIQKMKDAFSIQLLVEKEEASRTFLSLVWLRPALNWKEGDNRDLEKVLYNTLTGSRELSEEEQADNILTYVKTYLSDEKEMQNKVLESEREYHETKEEINRIEEKNTRDVEEYENEIKRLNEKNNENNKEITEVYKEMDHYIKSEKDKLNYSNSMNKAAKYEEMRVEQDVTDTRRDAYIKVGYEYNACLDNLYRHELQSRILQIEKHPSDYDGQINSVNEMISELSEAKTEMEKKCEEIEKKAGMALERLLEKDIDTSNYLTGKGGKVPEIPELKELMKAENQKKAISDKIAIFTKINDKLKQLQSDEKNKNKK